MTNIVRAACSKRERIYISIAAALLACCAFGLVGCGNKDGVALVAPDEIVMYVGETRDFMPYVVYPNGGKDVPIDFVSSDENVVDTLGSVVRAIAPGYATVEVLGGDGAVGITVKYRDASSLEIAGSDNIIQNVKDLSEVTEVQFNAVTDDFADPTSRVEWRIDGNVVSLENGFTFEPTRFGAFVVTAALENLTEHETVLVYRATEAHGEVLGDTSQMRNFAPVTFVAYEKIDTRNPSSTVVWTVNGVEASRQKTFVFTPSAQGRYEIELYVNGVKRVIDGNESAVIDARGERAPNGRVAINSDGVYIVWSDGGSARSVVITTPSGERTAFSSSDISYAYRFGDGVFDATGLIDVTSDNEGSYSIAVSAVALGETFTFTQYGEEARGYIENKVLMGNSFIDSASRAEAYVHELYACGIKSARAYIARDVNAEDVLAAARTAASSLMPDASFTVDGSIMTSELGEYSNVPTSVSEPVSERRMYSVLPHIEYSEANRRANGYALAVDRIKRTVAVSGTEQLLLSVMSGYRPVPASGSVASNVYDGARRTLLSIIGKDYSQERKVHAVYDWLQWSVFKAEGERESSGNYLESVFYSGGGRPSYTVTSLGAAKAFALMCSMEGIATEIVPIDDGSSYYYINTVVLDGVKYIVDVFGGEYGMSASRELSTHERLLIDGETAIKLGIYNESCEGVLGANDGGAMYYLQKHVSGDVYYDYFVSAAEKTDYAPIKAAVFGAFDGCTRGEVSIFAVTGTTSIMNETFGAEFFLDCALDAADADKVIANVLKAVDEYAKARFGESFRDGAVSAYTVGQALVVTAIMPRVG